MTANTATQKVCGAPRPEDRPMRSKLQIVVNVKVDAATIILAIAVPLKTLL